MAGITSQMDRPPSVLSPGHQRIVEVAMAAMTMPSLLILDEPTQGLGEQDIGLINRMIEALGDKTSLMIIEHNIEFVLKIAEKIVVLDRGRILMEGTPEEVVTNESVQRVYLGR
jgi:branched-chain amino acid transport system ATP-binding protein